VRFACGIAVDSAHVYWNNDPFTSDSIGRANLDGSAVDPSFITGIGVGCGITADEAHVYWANDLDESIGRVNLDGSGLDRSFIDSAEGICAGQIAVDAAHVYWANGTNDAIGRANLDGSAVKPRFIRGANFPCGVAVDPHSPSPPLEFSLGGVKKNKRKGTAKLTVNAPGPGELELAQTTKVKGDEETVEAAGTEKLSIKPKGKAKKKLNAKGKAKVKAEVTYTPDGGSPNTDTKTVKLRKR
jgi:hypothetical protein